MAFWTFWGDNKKWKAEKAERDEAITATKLAKESCHIKVKRANSYYQKEFTWSDGRAGK